MVKPGKKENYQIWQLRSFCAPLRGLMSVRQEQSIALLLSEGYKDITMIGSGSFASVRIGFLSPHLFFLLTFLSSTQ